MKKDYPDISSSLTQCEKDIFTVMQRSIHIEYIRNEKEKLNGTAHKYKGNLITLSGCWDDLASKDLIIARKSKIAFYYIIGHELGHLDSEPSILMPTKSFLKKVSYGFLALIRKDFRSHMRELRADYCGILFALAALDEFKLDSIEDRETIIEESFDYLIGKLKEKHKKDKADTAHPKLSARKTILLNHSRFDAETIKMLSTQFLCSESEVNQFCSCAFDGNLLKLQEPQNIGKEVKNG